MAQHPTENRAGDSISGSSTTVPVQRRGTAHMAQRPFALGTVYAMAAQPYRKTDAPPKEAGDGPASNNLSGKGVLDATSIP